MPVCCTFDTQLLIYVQKVSVESVPQIGYLVALDEESVNILQHHDLMEETQRSTASEVSSSVPISEQVDYHISQSNDIRLSTGKFLFILLGIASISLSNYKRLLSF